MKLGMKTDGNQRQRLRVNFPKTPVMIANATAREVTMVGYCSIETNKRPQMTHIVSVRQTGLIDLNFIVQFTHTSHAYSSDEP